MVQWACRSCFPGVQAGGNGWKRVIMPDERQDLDQIRQRAILWIEHFIAEFEAAKPGTELRDTWRLELWINRAVAELGYTRLPFHRPVETSEDKREHRRWQHVRDPVTGVTLCRYWGFKREAGRTRSIVGGMDADVFHQDGLRALRRWRMVLQTNATDVWSEAGEEEHAKAGDWSSEGGRLIAGRPEDLTGWVVQFFNEWEEENERRKRRGLRPLVPPGSRRLATYLSKHGYSMSHPVANALINKLRDEGVLFPAWDITNSRAPADIDPEDATGSGEFLRHSSVTRRLKKPIRDDE